MKSKTEIFIEKSRKVHGDLYDYSKVNYINSRSRVIITDPKYGDFEQTPKNHLSGKQNRLRISNKRRLTLREFIIRSKKIHGDLYDYSKVNYVNAQTPIIIIDPVYGEFSQRPWDHLSGKGNSKRKGGVKSNTKEFIEKARKVHGDLYDYSKVNYINNSTKVIIIDPEYGEFLQRPEVHLLGKGNINRNIKHTFEVDHILPFSLLCKTVDRCYYLNTKIGKLFNSSFNKKILSVSENKTKSDNIILFGKIIKGRNYRGDYELIRYLFKRNYYIDINLYI